MRTYKAIFCCGALIFNISVIQAQIINTTTGGMTQGQVWANIYGDNARAAAAQAAMSANSMMTAALIAEAKAKQARIEKAGAAKIAAGKATVAFMPSATATEELAKSMTWDDEQPTLESQVAHIQKMVRRFEQLMRQNGYTPKDLSSGYAFAYALSHAAYYNRDIDRAKVKQIEQKDRDFGMNSAFCQGVDDATKQRQYELSAVMAMQAAEWRAKYRRTTNEAERQEYDAKAKADANYTIEVDKKSE